MEDALVYFLFSELRMLSVVFLIKQLPQQELRRDGVWSAIFLGRNVLIKVASFVTIEKENSFKI